MRRGFHACPARCGAEIPNRLYACREDWDRLSPEVQTEIVRTRRMPLTEGARLRAYRAAVAQWRESDR